jgi:hypothetical protein
MELRAVKEDFLDVFDSLSDNVIKNAIKDVIESLKKDNIVGEHVKKNQIPKYYIKKYNIQILYRMALPKKWRLTYSIVEFEVGGEVGVLMLELMNHDKYNKRFGYYKKRSA